MKKILIIIFSALSAVSLALLIFTIVTLSGARHQLDAFVSEEESFHQALEAPPEVQFINQAALDLWSVPKEEAEETDDIAQFTSPEGILFRSQSKAWDQAKLADLHAELLLNKHGEELNYLSQVIVLPQADENAAAFYEDHATTFTLGLPFPCLPQEDVFSFYRTCGVITLYNGDEQNTVALQANSLSHEYGHHYTFFHMIGDLFVGTPYAQLRWMDSSRIRTTGVSDKDYWLNHHWYYFEIAAEDYVVLMGSPTTRQAGNYCDVRDLLNGLEGDTFPYRNIDVQENLMLPMASQIPGLAELFYSFIDEPAPSFAPKKLTLSIDKDTSRYNLVTGSKSFTHYTIRWDKVYGEDAVYTLVCYDPDNYKDSLYPIRTVTQDEESEGIIGNYVRVTGDMVHYWYDELDQGTKIFQVTVVCPDGSMYLSDPLTYTF
ncbi:MAG: hypothetical protein IKM13_09275 [Clostridia bacterium]|nr:hypothetical protein [Clostridia bacterium]